MKIYPISQMVEDLLAAYTDEETGEITATEEELAERMDALNIDFDQRIRDLRNEYINVMSEAAAIKNEKMRLAERQRIAEKKADWLKRYIAYLTQGEFYQKDDVRISYRKSEETVIEDGFISWALTYYPGLLDYKDPEPNKGRIKEILKKGKQLNFAHINTKNNIIIK